MTLDETIKNYEEEAEAWRTDAEVLRNWLMDDDDVPEPVKNCLENAEESEQLVEWLKELKKFREQRPHGEWLFKEITDDYRVYGQCSVCKFRKRIDNYCPNCGAKMDGKETDNEQ